MPWLSCENATRLENLRHNVLQGFDVTQRVYASFKIKSAHEYIPLEILSTKVQGQKITYRHRILAATHARRVSCSSRIRASASKSIEIEYFVGKTARPTITSIIRCNECLRV